MRVRPFSTSRPRMALFAGLGLAILGGAASVSPMAGAQQPAMSEWKHGLLASDGREIQFKATPAPACDGSNVELRLLNNTQQSGQSTMNAIQLACKRGQNFSAPDQPLGVVSAGGEGISAVIPCACAEQGGVTAVRSLVLDFKLQGQNSETLTDGCVYTGSFQNAQRSGMGKLTCPTGLSYQGMFRNGQPNGEGQQTLADGTSYKGAFTDAKFDGRGQYKFTDGAVYEGEWKMGKREGVGTITFADGSQYIGDWRNDRRNGQGTFTGPKLGYTYDGAWVDDRRVGQGRMVYSDGSYTYEGAFVNDKPSGMGTATFNDGRVFRGEYRDGAQSGQGTMTYPNGRKIVGNFLDHVPNGQASDISPTLTFEGNWVNGKLDGHGVVTGNGTRFEGEFRNGKRNGPGTEVRADGARMDCTYIDDVAQKGCKTVKGKNPKIEYRK